MQSPLKARLKASVIMTDGFKISHSELGEFSASFFSHQVDLHQNGHNSAFLQTQKIVSDQKASAFFAKKTNFNFSKRVSLQEQETKQMHGALNIETSV